MTKKHNPIVYLYMVLVFIALFAIIPLVELGGDKILSYSRSDDMSVSVAIMKSIFALIGSVAMFLISNAFLKAISYRPIHIGRPDRIFWIKLVQSFAVIAAILIAASVALYFQTGNTKYLKWDMSMPIAMMIIQISPAFMEEFVFRGFFMNFFIQKNRKYTGLIISSSIFGVIHLLNLLMGMEVSVLDLVNITSGGLLLGLTYINFGLPGSILVHFLWNTCDYMHKYSDFPIATVIIVIAIAFLFWLDFRKGRR